MALRVGSFVLADFSFQSQEVTFAVQPLCFSLFLFCVLTVQQKLSKTWWHSRTLSNAALRCQVLVSNWKDIKTKNKRRIVSAHEY